MSISEQIQKEVLALPPAEQRRVLEFIHALREELADEQSALGQASLRLAGKILDPEDFSSWEKTGLKNLDV